jgi:D-alanyl-D-alanine carboxypeptidase
VAVDLQNNILRKTYLSISELTKLPHNTNGIKAPDLTARSVLIIDYDSGSIIYQKNADSTHLPASTTKIMTALVTLDSYDLDQVLTVPELTYEGQDIQLRKGEQITVENLLNALLVASANDAAETLAANYPKGRAAFIAAMNQKAKDLFLDNTHFVNPTGFDESGQYTTPFDLVKLAKTLLSDPLLAQIVATKKTEVYNVDHSIVHPVSNINQLLGQVAGLKGVKTGWTTNAGECLTTFVDRDGARIMTVVLGSEDRFGETTQLIDWVYDNFDWKVPGF